MVYEFAAGYSFRLLGYVGVPGLLGGFPETYIAGFDREMGDEDMVGQRIGHGHEDRVVVAPRDESDPRPTWWLLREMRMTLGQRGERWK